jgi:hypothetical protein
MGLIVPEVLPADLFFQLGEFRFLPIGVKETSASRSRGKQGSHIFLKAHQSSGFILSNAHQVAPLPVPY